MTILLNFFRFVLPWDTHRQVQIAIESEVHSTPTELRVIALESQGSNFDQISISNCTPAPALPKAILTLAKRIEHVRYMMQGTLELKILQCKRSETLA